MGYDVTMQYQKWYTQISEPFRSEAAQGVINVLDRGLVYLIAAAYIATLIYLGATGDLRFWRMLVIPGGVFVLVTAMRIMINAPRPYEEFNIDPIIKKETVGESLPSRHVASAVIIGCAFLWLNPIAGIATLIASVIVAFTRIVGGVHYPRDIVVSFILALAFAFIGFVLIP